MKRKSTFRRVIFGKGINDYEEVMKEEGADYIHYEDPLYRRWHSMFRRCYSESYLARTSTQNYQRVEVCEEWTKFSNFRKWAKAQDWQGNDLDKDLTSSITGLSVYSPETCLFIPQELNKFLCLRGNDRGEYPVGVIYKKDNKKYCARVCTPAKRLHLGYYHTPEQAHKAWQLAKWKYGQELLQQQTDPRIIQAMHVILHNLGEDWAAGRETKTLTI